MKCRFVPEGISRSPVRHTPSTTKTSRLKKSSAGTGTGFHLWEIQSTVEEPVDRAYSMANYPEEKGIIMLNIRVATPPPRSPNGTTSGKDVLLHLQSEAG